MHPILAQELMRALDHEMRERVGRPRVPRRRKPQAVASAHPMRRRRALRGLAREVRTTPLPGVERSHDGARQVRDWWLLYGPRWH